MIAVTILGNNSAVPAYGRHPTAQLVQTQNHFFLVDCGEGTQMQMTKYKIKRNKINHIFISHLHGDHYFGLIGLLNSFALNRREHELHIYSPAGLEEIIRLQLHIADSQLPFPLLFHNLQHDGDIMDDDKIKVSAFKVHHRIECFGFIFREKKFPRKLNIDQVRKYKVPKQFYDRLHEGEDYTTPEKNIIRNELLTTAAAPAKSYAYCADTSYFENICHHIRNVDLVYHESTYLHAMEEKAKARFHSTTIHAATIAKKSNAGRLLLGHFSSMYEELEIFREEACTVFENTEVSREGTCYIA